MNGITRAGDNSRAGIELAAGRLARLRNENTMTRLELATASGISVSALSAYENGQRRPRARALRKLCEALACQPAELVARTQEEER